MIITPHMLVGAAIGAQTSNIWAAFSFGFLSHFLLDALPHWDYLRKIDISKSSHRRKMGFDLILGTVSVLIFVWFYPENFLFLIVGALAALIPDCIQYLYYTFNISWLERISWFHEKVHWKQVSFWPGLPFMLVVCLAAIFVLTG